VKSVRICRELLGISQETLIKRSGVCRQSLSQFENGHAYPSRRLGEAVENALESLVDERVVAAVILHPELASTLDYRTLDKIIEALGAARLTALARAVSAPATDREPEQSASDAAE
jgi:transcriptional regulator with XRE-family HTH domain